MLPKQVSAELLLHVLYPDIDNLWAVKCEGSFYRNYNPDILSIDTDNAELSLSRDGFFHLLPDALISDVDSLKGDDFDEKYKQLRWRTTLLREAFVPFDTFSFRRSLSLELITSDLLNTKLSFVLAHFFAINIDAITDPLVRQAATLLPFVSSLRGNIHFVRHLFADLCHCSTSLDLSHRYSTSDSSSAWLPEARIALLIPDVNSQQQLQQQHLRIAPLVDFVSDWFVPFDLHLVVSVHSDALPVVSNSTLLDYNASILP